MSRTARTRHLAAPTSSPEPLLSGAERAELQRQGAKAAARGELPDSNPLNQPQNRPSATGELADKWLQRSDAWEHGHEVQSSARRDADQPSSEAQGDGHD
jgi:hypothetical protein